MSFRKSAATVGISLSTHRRRLPRRTKLLLAMTHYTNKVFSPTNIHYFPHQKPHIFDSFRSFLNKFTHKVYSIAKILYLCTIFRILHSQVQQKSMQEK